MNISKSIFLLRCVPAYIPFVFSQGYICNFVFGVDIDDLYPPPPGLKSEDQLIEELYNSSYSSFVEEVDAVDNGISDRDGAPR